MLKFLSLKNISDENYMESSYERREFFVFKGLKFANSVKEQ
jgi:hypothetical protein